MWIRTATGADAPRYRQLRANLLSEFPFMLRELGEYQPAEKRLVDSGAR